MSTQGTRLQAHVVASSKPVKVSHGLDGQQQGKPSGLATLKTFRTLYLDVPLSLQPSTVADLQPQVPSLEMLRSQSDLNAKDGQVLKVRHDTVTDSQEAIAVLSETTIVSLPYKLLRWKLIFCAALR